MSTVHAVITIETHYSIQEAMYKAAEALKCEKRSPHLALLQRRLLRPTQRNK